jgi:glycopeptide antibiotics resistance protein
MRSVTTSTPLAARLAIACYLVVAALLTLTPIGSTPVEPNLVPGAGILATYRDAGLAFAVSQVIGNLLLLAPIGFLLPFALPGIGFWPGVACALALSVAIELAQWLANAGRMGDIDDVMLNTVGAAVAMVPALLLARSEPG